MEKRLCKIKSITLGYGGYQDCELGITVHLSDNSFSVIDFKGFWDANIIKHTPDTKWTIEDRDKSYADVMLKISGLLREAKVDSLEKLNGKPCEATFDGNMLKSWRILTEVL